MNVHMVIAHIEKGDTVTAELHRPGEVMMKIGGGVMVWIYERTNPKVFADICRRFDLQKETAPSGDTGDGSEREGLQLESKEGVT